MLAGNAVRIQGPVMKFLLMLPVNFLLFFPVLCVLEQIIFIVCPLAC